MGEELDGGRDVGVADRVDRTVDERLAAVGRDSRRDDDGDACAVGASHVRAQLAYDTGDAQPSCERARVVTSHREVAVVEE